MASKSSKPPKLSPSLKTDKALTEADYEVWQRVSRTVRPYQPQSQSRPRLAPTPKTSAKAASASAKPRWPQTEKLGRKTPAIPPEVMADKRTRRGKIAIDRRLDLHDMTQDQAQASLERLILAGAAKNYRCILVVTGKGGINHKGVLRRMLPIWLAAPSIRPHIARYAGAHQRHGGQGAFYVFLKS